MGSDTLPVHHSFCVNINKYDRDFKTVVSSTICDTTNGNTYFLFDTSRIGMQYDDYFDTSGKVIFETVSKNGMENQQEWNIKKDI